MTEWQAAAEPAKRWTFEAKNGEYFEMSSQRFDTSEEALSAAIEWLTVGLANSFYPAVAIVELDDKGHKVR